MNHPDLLHPNTQKPEMLETSGAPGPEDIAAAEQPSSTKKASRHIIRSLLLASVVIFATATISFGTYAYSVTRNRITEKQDQTNFFGQVHRILDENVEPLQGEQRDLITLALYGEGGWDHPGGTLTDSIMVAFIKPSTHDVALLSIPRDLVITYDENPEDDYFEYRKINYAVELGGIAFANEKIQEVTGVSVDYYVLLDFDGFRNIIDDLGGVPVTVENSFTDYEYPDYAYGYQTIAFDAGTQQMNGETALQFARSRHGNNGEGSDFARAKRQQKILEAVQEKSLRLSTLANPARLSNILSDLGNHISTNMEIWEMMRFARIAREVDRQKIINKVIDNSANGLLVSEISPETGAYILVPRKGAGKFGEVHQLVKKIFKQAEVVTEKAHLAVQNGSGINGLAKIVAHLLEAADLPVEQQGNAMEHTLEETTIYDLTHGTKPLTSKALDDLLPGKIIPATRTEGSTGDVRLSTDLNPAVIVMADLPDVLDFIIVLGRDAQGLQQPLGIGNK